ncbi:hypothetical protein RF11_14418 [Thelohanellus kitauei]|uniref:Uncharacterized protein n=1 Tax=Thelohanellus kitauei TaxID=669202 RepID=A0A0C2MU87_THEKT|nr:hypothetical protein RF11_14418 [Thelohanellus kitauei]
MLTVQPYLEVRKCQGDTRFYSSDKQSGFFYFLPIIGKRLANFYVSLHEIDLVIVSFRPTSIHLFIKASYIDEEIVKIDKKNNSVCSTPILGVRTLCPASRTTCCISDDIFHPFFRE